MEGEEENELEFFDLGFKGKIIINKKNKKEWKL